MEPYAIVALLLSSAVLVLAVALVRGKYSIKASRPHAAQGINGIDKQHLEQQLAAAVELNEQILSAAPIGILVYTADGSCIAANGAAAAIVGGSYDELRRQNFRELESWRKSGLGDLVEHALTTNVPQRQELYIASSFGKELWLDCCTAPLVADAATHVLLIISDTSARKQVERELARHQQELELLVHERTAELTVMNTCLQQEVAQRKRLEEKLTIFSRAIEQSPVSITITDIDGIINYVNPRYTQQSGYSFEEVCGKRPRVLSMNPQPPEGHQLWQAIHTGTEWHGELQNTSKSGRTYWESGVVSPIVDPLGHVTHVVAMMEDVTHLKQQEREREAMLAVASALRTVSSRAEMLPIILQQVCTSLEATVAFCTAPAPADGSLIIEAACKNGACSWEIAVPIPPAPGASELVRRGCEPWQTDYVGDGLMGDPLLAALPIITEERAAACVPLIAQETVIGGLWVARKTPLGDSDLRLLNAIADMTAAGLQRAALLEQSLRNAADLEAEVAARTRELTEANQRLQELDKLKSKFVSDVSHELRTPVTNVGLYLQLMELKPEKSEHYLKVLREQARRLEMLVTEVLDLSRLDNTQGLAMAPVNLDAVLATVVIAQEPRAEARGLVLHFQPYPAPAEGELAGSPYSETPWVLGDQARLEQVVTNLVANAVNYTPSGCVKVSSRPGVTPGTIQFDVADTGIGIYPEDVPHLFERFYRGRRDQVVDVPGTGLGLVIVKELVDRHGGTISVQSDIGVGTTFTVTLPAAPPVELQASSSLFQSA